MNFRKGCKRQLTPTLQPSEWSLSLEIMCMHFILSGPPTSLHICNHIHYKKKLQHNFPKMRGGGGSKAVWNFSEILSAFVALPVSKGNKKIEEMLYFFFQITNVAQQGEIERVKDVLLQVATQP